MPFLEDGWLAEYSGKPQTRCEAVLDGEEVIGFTIVAKTGTDDAEYRIALRADRLGQGLGTIITRMTLERAFSQMGLARIHLIVRKNNPGARRLYEKIGFAEKGERVLEIRGNSVPFIEMDLHPQALAGTARGECL
ncbi:GNAT family protein [Acidiferrobacter sp.]|jgi:diamine N-acetyltransferase|uniref:GNAT family N-acetyltransferase n=1 Tax=Acidiferrobacter sp. TaxID=1872107 RepID=UPI00262B625B|nr:GNAT family protein [Acidiferrobacter sp.]